jgi:uncharacterized damage-inducible protein DinB
LEEEMDAAVAPLAGIFELNADLLLNCLADLSDDEAQARISGGGNTILFLAAHLTDTRHALAARLGSPLHNPLARYLADARGIDDIRSWPSLAEVRDAWVAVSQHLSLVLGSVSRAGAVQAVTHRLSLDGTQLGVIAFLAQHDSYHVGQVAFLRRQLGKPAMSYARGARRGSPAGAAPAEGRLEVR